MLSSHSPDSFLKSALPACLVDVLLIITLHLVIALVSPMFVSSTVFCFEVPYMPYLLLRMLSLSYLSPQRALSPY